MEADKLLIDAGERAWDLVGDLAGRLLGSFHDLWLLLGLGCARLLGCARDDFAVLKDTLDKEVVWDIAVVAIVKALLAQVKVTLLAGAAVPMVVRNGIVALVAAHAERVEWRAREARHLGLGRSVEERWQLAAESSGVVLRDVIT